MKFLKYFFSVTVLLFILFYGFIVAVDPYNKLGINVFGFETKAVDFPRVNKFNQLEHATKKYEAFILGSSAAHRYHTSVLEEITGLATYNYAVQSAMPEDYLAMFNHIVSKFKPKLVVLSMDFYGLNEYQKTDEMFYISPLKDYLSKETTYEIKEEEVPGLFNKTYFTLEALKDSFKVVWTNILGQTRHAYVEDGNYFKEKPAKGPIAISNFTYPPYKFSQTRIELLKTLKKRADELGINIVVFTAPMSYEHWKKIDDDATLKAQLVQFKTILNHVFGDVYDLNNAEMKTYDDIKYFRDSVHPTVEFSGMILKMVFKDRPL